MKNLIYGLIFIVMVLLMLLPVITVSLEMEKPKVIYKLKDGELIRRLEYE